MMQKWKISLFLGIVLVLVQFIEAVPTPSDGDTKSSEDNDNDKLNEIPTRDENKQTQTEDVELNERQKLYMFNYVAASSLANYTIFEGRNILSNVIKDVSMEKDKSPALQQKILNFSEFVETVDGISVKESDVGNSSQLFVLMSRFAKMMVECITDEMEKPTDDDLLIESLIKKNGLDVLENNFKERFNDFSNKLSQRVDEYLSTLSAEEKIREQKMIEWHKKFNDEKDWKTKLSIASEFIDIY